MLAVGPACPSNHLNVVAAGKEVLQVVGVVPAICMCGYRRLHGHPQAIKQAHMMVLAYRHLLGKEVAQQLRLAALQQVAESTSNPNCVLARAGSNVGRGGGDGFHEEFIGDVCRWQVWQWFIGKGTGRSGISIF
jgi:hypothetical protein